MLNIILYIYTSISTSTYSFVMHLLRQFANFLNWVVCYCCPKYLLYILNLNLLSDKCFVNIFFQSVNWFPQEFLHNRVFNFFLSSIILLMLYLKIHGKIKGQLNFSIFFSRKFIIQSFTFRSEVHFLNYLLYMYATRSVCLFA